jgi:hypothetical protein
MVSDFLQQRGVSQYFARLRVYVNLPHLAQPPLGGQCQEDRHAPAETIILYDQCRHVATQAGADLVQQQRVDLATGDEGINEPK